MKDYLISTLIIFSSGSYAGGSHENVEILHFYVFEEYQYILVVKPSINSSNGNYKDPYMGLCSIFTVLGRYEKLGFFESGNRPTKNEYIEAITYLKTKPDKIKLDGCKKGEKGDATLYFL